MEASSVNKLCEQLISFGIQRCRLSGDPCRLTVVIRLSTIPDHNRAPLVGGEKGLRVTQISISDTGAGSYLKEFQDLKYSCYGVSAETCGVLSITTTSISDSELFHYILNLKESASSKRLTKLPSTSKNNAKFSGTEVSMSISNDMEVLLADITSFFRKNIAIELIADCGDKREKIVLATELTSLPSPESSNIEQLTSGLEDYVHRHGNGLSHKCQSCFSSSDDLKVGNGLARTHKHMNDALIIEVVIMISESLNPLCSSCFKTLEPKTEVLYFRDFSPYSIDQSALEAFESIKWNNYGMTLKSIVDQEGSAFLEWENLPPNTHIDIALHCYKKQVVVPPLRQRTQMERKLMKKSITLALGDLKEKYTGVLLSAHAQKIRSYAPDLARSIAGFILSSEDPNFQSECFSLLEFQSKNIEGDSVELCIREKIISAIDINDRKPLTSRSREAAPFLFEEDNLHEPEYMLDDCKEGEDEYTLMDF